MQSEFQAKPKYRRTLKLVWFLSFCLLFWITGCTTDLFLQTDSLSPLDSQSIALKPPTPFVTPSTTPIPSATPPPTNTPIPPPTPVLGQPPFGYQLATLDEYWDGQAEWLLEVADTGLPIGESETIHMGDNELWSYLHASFQSAGVVDQCGTPVPFPGCTTLWQSHDGGHTFALENPVCLFSCQTCPCTNDRDHIEQQQYPRVFIQDGMWFLVYENGALTYMRTSGNGLQWSNAQHIPGTGIWPLDYAHCNNLKRIGLHPNILPENQVYDCLAGAPPGIFIEDNRIYVFVALGQSPSHMGCFMGELGWETAVFQECNTQPLFSNTTGYGPVDQTGFAANPHFDFRFISSADVVHVGDRYYMTYEGVRGPDNPAVGDTQFGLGIARSTTTQIDSPWETYSGNPIIMDLPGDVGVGHADLVLIGDATYLYTTTPEGTRGRYLLIHK